MDLRDKTVLITGGTGSLGKAIIKHIVKNIQISAVKDTVLKWNLTSILRLYLPI